MLIISKSTLFQVIPVFNRTDLRRAYKWIKRKDDSQWVVPEKSKKACKSVNLLSTGHKVYGLMRHSLYANTHVTVAEWSRAWRFHSS